MPGLEALQALLQLVLEGIAHGCQDHIRVGGQRFAGGTGAPAAAADQPDSKRLMVDDR